MRPPSATRRHFLTAAAARKRPRRGRAVLPARWTRTQPPPLPRRAPPRPAGV